MMMNGNYKSFGNRTVRQERRTKNSNESNEKQQIKLKKMLTKHCKFAIIHFAFSKDALQFNKRKS